MWVQPIYCTARCFMCQASQANKAENIPFFVSVFTTTFVSIGLYQVLLSVTTVYDDCIRYYYQVRLYMTTLSGITIRYGCIWRLYQVRLYQSRLYQVRLYLTNVSGTTISPDCIRYDCIRYDYQVQLSDNCIRYDYQVRLYLTTVSLTIVSVSTSVFLAMSP